jgi:adenylosuccinate lyase
MRQGQADNDVLTRLAADRQLGLGESELRRLVAEPLTFTGAALDQVRAVVRRVEQLTAAEPEAAGYRPGPIL